MRRRHKARHAAHERAHLVLSVPHVQRDRGFPGAQPSPVRPIPPHLRRNQVRTVFCIVTCFICQSEFKQESSRSGAAKRDETWCVLGWNAHGFIPIVSAGRAKPKPIHVMFSMRAVGFPRAV